MTQCSHILEGSSLISPEPSIRPNVSHTQSICVQSQFSSTLTYPKKMPRIPLIVQPMCLLTLLITLIIKQTEDDRKPIIMRRKQMTRSTQRCGPMFAMVWWTTKYKSSSWVFNWLGQYWQRFVHLCNQSFFFPFTILSNESCGSLLLILRTPLWSSFLCGIRHSLLTIFPHVWCLVISQLAAIPLLTC